MANNNNQDYETHGMNQAWHDVCDDLFCEYGTCTAAPLVACSTCGNKVCAKHFSVLYEECLDCRVRREESAR